MKKLYHLLFLLFAAVNISHAQFSQVSHLSGTQPYATTNVTVNYVGPGAASYIVPQCNATNAYALSSYINNGYQFVFSRPITRARFHIYHLEKNDTAKVWVNGVKYNLTMANLSTPVSTVGCTTTIPTTVYNGDLVYGGIGTTCGTSGAPGFNGQVEISLTTMIDSIRMQETYPNCSGFGMYFYFASDTLPYIKQPLTIPALCPGDTLKVPYIVSNRFNNGNTFSVQLSNAAGSFASPVTIGTRADTTGDTIVCVIPRTTIAGTGYRIRIAGSSPAGISFDNGTNITIKALAANRTVSSNSPLCQPDTVRLFSSTTTSGVTYSWTGPNGFSSSLQNPRTGNSTSTTHSGNYIVTMTTNLGCTTRDTTVVNVKPLPNKPVAGNNSPLCTGTTLSLADSATNTGATYTWTGPNSFSSTSQNPSKGSVTTADNGSYIVTATINGCSMKDTTVVTVFPITPTPTAGNTGPYCTGSDIQL
ncbi:MAG TPA: hypothetical protein VK167_15505, partial [Flavipsychrobacter sp.]|nr:hypothetical protein [Flavipsychrobacter sp.]